MKYAAALVAAAGLIAAQSPADFFPECAISCLDDAVTSTTSCSLTDYTCQCTSENQAAIQGGATACVITACGADVALNEVLPAAESFCAAVAAGGSSTTVVETTAEPTTSAEETTAAEITAVETTMTTTTPTGAGSNTTEPTSTSTPIEVNAAGAAAPMGGFVALILAALAAF